MIFLPLIPITLALMLILFQEVDLRITYENGLSVHISFTIFSLTLLDDGKDKFSIKGSLRFARSVPIILKASRYAIRRSNVTVFRLSHTVKPSLLDTLLRTLLIFLSASSLLSYVVTNAATYKVSEDGYSSDDTASIDILFETRALHLIISGFLFLYYTVRRKVRRAIKNV